MAPKKKKKGACKGDDPGDLDSCFEKSPFSCASMISLEFEKGDSLKIHRDLLNRNPKLATLDAGVGPSPNPLSAGLKCISRSAGHVLVQYLYTDNYRTLKWVGPTDSQKETIAKFEIAFEVYATARELELEELEALAREEITLLSKDIDAFTIIDVVEKAYPCAKSNDNWFPIFIKDTIKTAFETPQTPPPAEMASGTTPDDAPAGVQTAQDATLASLLLQGASEIYREKINALTIKPTHQRAAGQAPLSGSLKALENSKSSFSAWGRALDNHAAEPGGWNFGNTEKAKEEKAAESVQDSAEEVKQDKPDPKKAETVDEFVIWGVRATQDKNKKKCSIWDGPVPDPVEEAKQVEPEPEKVGTEVEFAALPVTVTSKKKKKKTSIWDSKPEAIEVPVVVMEDCAVAMDDSEVMAGPAPILSPIEEGWVGREPHLWSS